MRILLATDGSPEAEAAINVVLNHPCPATTTIRVLTAAPSPYPLAAYAWYMPEQSLADLGEQSQRRAREIAEAAAARLREHGLAAESAVREGDPRVAIVQEATDWNADLIVVGSHGHTGLRKLLLGSVAQHVVAHAPCSVQVARHRG